jgi:hypothetical protein
MRRRLKHMKSLIALTAILFAAQSFAADTPVPTPQSKAAVHRYLVERTFPPDALKGLDAATKKKVNANNAAVGVRWVESYANASETKTFRTPTPNCSILLTLRGSRRRARCGHHTERIGGRNRFGPRGLRHRGGRAGK